MKDKLQEILHNIDHNLIEWKAEIYDYQQKITVLEHKINSLKNHKSATERVVNIMEDNNETN